MEPVHIDHNDYLVHAFRPEDIQREPQVSVDIFEIFSDDDSMQYLPGKKLLSLEEAKNYFRGNLLNYHAGKNYLHFITEKRSGNIVGILDLISPNIVREHYILHQYPYFIEFYLKREFQGCGIMGTILPEFLKHINYRNIKDIGAVVNRENLPAKKLITNTGFSMVSGFDFMQDFYLNILN